MADSQSPASGDWNTYLPGYTPYDPGNSPVNPGGQAPDPAAATGLLGRWKLPMFNSQFQYPQGLLAQIAMSQQPMQHSGPGAFPRMQFGQQMQGIPPPQRQPMMGMNPGLPGLLGQIAQMMAAKTGAK